MAHYVSQALRRRFPDGFTWLPTYPVTLAERIAYHRDRRAWRARLVDRINTSSCDLAIFINHLGSFAQLDLGCPRLLWITDDPRPLREALPLYDRVYISDPGYAAEVRAAAGDRRYAGVLPFAMDPDIHVPHPGTGRGRDACFIANRDPKRDAVLKELLSFGQRLTVHGNYFLRSPLFFRHPWHFRPAVPLARMGRVYARYAVSLNIHAQVVRGGTNMRSFECAGYGIAQMVEYRPGIEELFLPGEEILTYTSVDELRSGLERLQRDPQLAARLARNAHQRVLSEHTYHHRIDRLMSGLPDAV